MHGPVSPQCRGFPISLLEKSLRPQEVKMLGPVAVHISKPGSISCPDVVCQTSAQRRTGLNQRVSEFLADFLVRLCRQILIVDHALHCLLQLEIWVAAPFGKIQATPLEI